MCIQSSCTIVYNLALDRGRRSLQSARAQIAPRALRVCEARRKAPKPLGFYARKEYTHDPPKPWHFRALRESPLRIALCARFCLSDAYEEYNQVKRICKNGPSRTPVPTKRASADCSASASRMRSKAQSAKAVRLLRSQGVYPPLHSMVKRAAFDQKTAENKLF